MEETESYLAELSQQTTYKINQRMSFNVELLEHLGRQLSVIDGDDEKPRGPYGDVGRRRALQLGRVRRPKRDLDRSRRRRGRRRARVPRGHGRNRRAGRRRRRSGRGCPSSARARARCTRFRPSAPNGLGAVVGWVAHDSMKLLYNTDTADGVGFAHIVSSDGDFHLAFRECELARGGPQLLRRPAQRGRGIRRRHRSHGAGHAAGDERLLGLHGGRPAARSELLPARSGRLVRHLGGSAFAVRHVRFGLFDLGHHWNDGLGPGFLRRVRGLSGLGHIAQEPRDQQAGVRRPGDGRAYGCAVRHAGDRAHQGSVAVFFGRARHRRLPPGQRQLRQSSRRRASAVPAQGHCGRPARGRSLRSRDGRPVQRHARRHPIRSLCAHGSTSWPSASTRSTARTTRRTSSSSTAGHAPSSGRATSSPSGTGRTPPAKPLLRRAGTCAAARFSATWITNG